jgi:hypothetical protein
MQTSALRPSQALLETQDQASPTTLDTPATPTPDVPAPLIAPMWTPCFTASGSSKLYHSGQPGIKSRPKQANPALPTCSPQIVNELEPREPRLPSCASVDTALPNSGLSLFSPTMQDTLATPMLDVPVPPMLDVPAPFSVKAPTGPVLFTRSHTCTPCFIDSVPSNCHDSSPLMPDKPAFLSNPSFILSGPSNPHDPGPPATAADYSFISFIHRVFSTIAIYIIIDFLFNPPRSPSM